jgi:hypothetical protein
MHGSVINVLANVDQTQSILPHLSHDDATIGVFLNQHFEYKLTYMLGNVRPYMVMVILRDLIEMSLYKDLNVTIHHQWASLFTLHMNSKFQILTFNNASSNNFDFDNEKMHYTPTDLMIHSFLNAPNIMD